MASQHQLMFLLLEGASPKTKFEWRYNLLDADKQKLPREGWVAKEDGYIYNKESDLKFKIDELELQPKDPYLLSAH